eukprot:TRINITY_DN6547_c0_g1_i1.p1 TRINITY_DN6547_c0_g1~~TRINITY_DN6547_c0_g1_i1.p1  ORF type:complete len:3087 (+),score=960.12 TRINITY_DN6547_c0_g1_i1:57-9263(+)
MPDEPPDTLTVLTPPNSGSRLCCILQGVGPSATLRDVRKRLVEAAAVASPVDFRRGFVFVRGGGVSVLADEGRRVAACAPTVPSKMGAPFGGRSPLLAAQSAGRNRRFAVFVRQGTGGELHDSDPTTLPISPDTAEGFVHSEPDVCERLCVTHDGLGVPRPAWRPLTRRCVNVRDLAGLPLLHTAVLAESEQDALSVLRFPGDVNVRDAAGRTALHVAAGLRDRCAAESFSAMLLRFGADADAVDGRMRTALHEAVRRRHEAVVRSLAGAMKERPAQDAAGYDPVSGWERGRDALSDLAARGDGQAMRDLLRHPLWRIRPGDGSLVHLASASGSVEAVRVAVDVVLRHLKRPAGEVIAAGDESGRSALHVAASRGHVAVLRWLLDAGASCAATDAAGRTPLHAALYSRKWAAAAALADAGGAAALTYDGTGMTPLAVAAGAGRRDLCRVMAAAGVAAPAAPRLVWLPHLPRAPAATQQRSEWRWDPSAAKYCNRHTFKQAEVRCGSADARCTRCRLRRAVAGCGVGMWEAQSRCRRRSMFQPLRKPELRKPWRPAGLSAALPDTELKRRPAMCFVRISRRRYESFGIDWGSDPQRPRVVGVSDAHACAEMELPLGYAVLDVRHTTDVPLSGGKLGVRWRGESCEAEAGPAEIRAGLEVVEVCPKLPPSKGGAVGLRDGAAVDAAVAAVGLPEVSVTLSNRVGGPAWRSPKDDIDSLTSATLLLADPRRVTRRCRRAGASVAVAPSWRCTPLGAAVLSGDAGTVLALGPAAATPRDHAREMLRHAATRSLDLAGAVLAAAGASAADVGAAALRSAVLATDLEAVEWLLQRGAPAAEEDALGFSALSEAAHSGFCAAVDAMVRCRGEAAPGRPAVLRALLSAAVAPVGCRGAEAPLLQALAGTSAEELAPSLHAAARAGNAAMIGGLLSRGADPSSHHDGCSCVWAALAAAPSVPGRRTDRSRRCIEDSIVLLVGRGADSGRDSARTAVDYLALAASKQLWGAARTLLRSVRPRLHTDDPHPANPCTAKGVFRIAPAAEPAGAEWREAVSAAECAAAPGLAAAVRAAGSLCRVGEEGRVVHDGAVCRKARETDRPPRLRVLLRADGWRGSFPRCPAAAAAMRGQLELLRTMVQYRGVVPRWVAGGKEACLLQLSVAEPELLPASWVPPFRAPVPMAPVPAGPVEDSGGGASDSDAGPRPPSWSLSAELAYRGRQDDLFTLLAGRRPWKGLVHAAAAGGNETLAEVLLDRGASAAPAEGRCGDVCSPVATAAALQQTAVALKAIHAPGADLDAAGSLTDCPALPPALRGLSLPPVYVAAATLQVEVVKELVAAGASAWPVGGQSAVHAALSAARGPSLARAAEVADACMPTKRPSACREVSVHGLSAAGKEQHVLTLAASRGLFGVVRALLDGCSDGEKLAAVKSACAVSATDRGWSTPHVLHYAVRDGAADLVELVLRQVSDVPLCAYDVLHNPAPGSRSRRSVGTLADWAIDAGRPALLTQLLLVGARPTRPAQRRGCLGPAADRAVCEALRARAEAGGDLLLRCVDAGGPVLDAVMGAVEARPEYRGRAPHASLCAAAVRTGDGSVVERVLRLREPQEGWSAVWAVRVGREDMLLTCLHHGASALQTERLPAPALTFGCGYVVQTASPLFLAASSGDHRLVALLQKHGADVTAMNTRCVQERKPRDGVAFDVWVSPVWAAVNGIWRRYSERHERVAVELVQCGGLSGMEPEDVSHCILVAVERRRFDVALKMLQAFAACRGGDELVEVSAARRAIFRSKHVHPLHAASECSPAAVHTLAFECAGGGTGVTGLFGMTALQWACAGGNCDAVSALLSRGVAAGGDALVAAARRGRDSVVRLLLDAGLGVDEVDGSGRTALEAAADRHQLDVLDLLLDSGATERLRAAVAAAQRGHEGPARLLAGGTVLADADLSTALPPAARGQRDELLRRLLSHADAAAAARDLTPLVVARVLRRRDCCAALLGDDDAVLPAAVTALLQCAAQLSRPSAAAGGRTFLQCAELLCGDPMPAAPLPDAGGALLQPAAAQLPAEGRTPAVCSVEDAVVRAAAGVHAHVDACSVREGQAAAAAAAALRRRLHRAIRQAAPPPCNAVVVRGGCAEAAESLLRGDLKELLSALGGVAPAVELRGGGGGVVMDGDAMVVGFGVRGVSTANLRAAAAIALSGADAAAESADLEQALEAARQRLSPVVPGISCKRRAADLDDPGTPTSASTTSSVDAPACRLPVVAMRQAVGEAADAVLQVSGGGGSVSAILRAALRRGLARLRVQCAAAPSCRLSSGPRCTLTIKVTEAGELPPHSSLSSALSAIPRAALAALRDEAAAAVDRVRRRATGYLPHARVVVDWKSVDRLPEASRLVGYELLCDPPAEYERIAAVDGCESVELLTLSGDAVRVASSGVRGCVSATAGGRPPVTLDRLEVGVDQCFRLPYVEVRGAGPVLLAAGGDGLAQAVAVCRASGTPHNLPGRLPCGRPHAVSSFVAAVGAGTDGRRFVAKITVRQSSSARTWIQIRDMPASSSHVRCFAQLPGGTFRCPRCGAAVEEVPGACTQRTAHLGACPAGPLVEAVYHVAVVGPFDARAGHAAGVAAASQIPDGVMPARAAACVFGWLLHWHVAARGERAVEAARMAAPRPPPSVSVLRVRAVAGREASVWVFAEHCRGAVAGTVRRGGADVADVQFAAQTPTVLRGSFRAPRRAGRYQLWLRCGDATHPPKEFRVLPDRPVSVSARQPPDTVLAQRRFVLRYDVRDRCGNRCLPPELRPRPVRRLAAALRAAAAAAPPRAAKNGARLPLSLHPPQSGLPPHLTCRISRRRSVPASAAAEVADALRVLSLHRGAAVRDARDAAAGAAPLTRRSAIAALRRLSGTAADAGPFRAAVTAAGVAVHVAAPASGEFTVRLAVGPLSSETALRVQPVGAALREAAPAAAALRLADAALLKAHFAEWRRQRRLQQPRRSAVSCLRDASAAWAAALRMRGSAAAGGADGMTRDEWSRFAVVARAAAAKEVPRRGKRRPVRAAASAARRPPEDVRLLRRLAALPAPVAEAEIAALGLRS